MKKRIIVTAAITACLALCAAVWTQTEKVEKTPTPSETTAVIAPQPTLPEAEKPVLPVVTEKKETEMPETKSAPETTTEELSSPTWTSWRLSAQITSTSPSRATPSRARWTCPSSPAATSMS